MIEGADAQADTALLDKAATAQPRAALALEAELGEKLALEGSVTPIGRALPAGLELEVLLLEDGIATRIERGENAGRTLEEASVVLEAKKALTLSRETSERTSFEMKLPVPGGAKRTNLHVAAVLREARTWRVVQALDVALVASDTH